MANNEEKIKAFFSDSKKVEALTDDEEFIKKVAGGNATYETYKEEFEKLGITLTPEEAEEIKKATEALLAVPVDALGEDTLKQVSGGGDVNIPMVAGLSITVASNVASYGCLIAQTVYRNEFNSALREGNIENIRKYHKLSQRLRAASMGLAGGSLVGGALMGYGALKEANQRSQGKLAQQAKELAGTLFSNS